LLQRGIRLLGPESGEQACGDIGPGRMMEPHDVVRRTADMFQRREFSGLTVLLTAGPTREAIDPVRYISNRSSGKMGYALAEAITEFGGHCILVTGPVTLKPPARVEVIEVESAEQMYDAVFDHLDRCQVFIGCAAVADYRPVFRLDSKMKKEQTELQLNLVQNQDILASVAKTGKVFSVGFAAETDDLEQHAKSKLEEKGIDMIAANWVNRPGLGFDQDENALSVIWPGGGKVLEHARKPQLARQLLQLIAERLKLSTH
jgi:phosphopantothenoylcysteine decarboxylase/phosphopantothenate--cysteine ligase